MIGHAWRVGAGLVLTTALGLSGCGREARAIGDAHRAGVGRTAIKLDHFGYRPDDAKVAIFTADPGSTVQVRTDSGAVVFSVPGGGGSIHRREGDGCGAREVWWVDFSPFRTGGRYHLFSAALGARSYEFVIAPDVYADVMRTALRTFFLQRCGRAKPRAYAGSWADEGACHRADAATAPARGQRDRGRRDLAGGWHDAGDYNKYVWRAASTAILFLLRAWEDDPQAFPDGGLGIPESGNAVADVLDEVRWELDFFLRMQLPDGSVLSRVHAAGDASGAAPPSIDAAARYYEDPTLESTAVFAGSCARGARVFAAAGQTEYAGVLRRAALAAWSWVEGQGDGDEKVWAAAEIFRLDSHVTSARRYVDGYHGGCSHRPTMVAAGGSHRSTMVAAGGSHRSTMVAAGGWSDASYGASRYDTHAAVTYAQAEGATASVVAAMREGIGRQVDEIFAADDVYRTGMPRASYHWGSNAARAEAGVFLLQAARLGATGSHTPAQCRRHALDILHFFHGQNPLGMVYLTNMAAQGGEHSSWQVFHNWFGQSEHSYSRANYVGKPPSVLEPDYPYFEGSDNHGRGDDKRSRLGPPPGFVPGGPNPNYSGDATPPARAGCPSLFYRDWNDQSAWTARTWEITEPSIGYQGPYVALAAAFVRP